MIRKFVVGLNAFLLLVGIFRIPGKFLENQSAPLEQTDLVMRDFANDGIVGRDILNHCGRAKTTVFANGFMSVAAKYFAEYDAKGKLRFDLSKNECVDFVSTSEAYSDAKSVELKIAQNIRLGTETWFIYSHLNDNEIGRLEQIAEKFGRVGDQQNYTGAGYFKLIVDVPNSSP